MRRKNNHWKDMVVILVISAMFMSSMPAQRADAFSIWHLLFPLISAFSSQAMNPEHTDVFMATAPSMALKTPTGDYLPPILSLRQQAVILRKGVLISEIKVGSNGNPLKKVEWYIDGDRRTMIKQEAPPFAIGTDHGNMIFDTANPFWVPGKIYYIGFRAISDRDEDVDGEHPGFNCIPVVILDDRPFQMAVSDPDYRQYLADSMGSLPAIPVSRHVDTDGNVGFSIGDGKGVPSTPTPPGVALPNNPVDGQIKEGLLIQAFFRGVPVNGGEIHLKRAEAAKQLLILQAGDLTDQTIVKLFLTDKDGKPTTETYSSLNKGSNRRLGFKNVKPGVYILKAQAMGADQAVGDPFELKVTMGNQ